MNIKTPSSSRNDAVEYKKSVVATSDRSKFQRTFNDFVALTLSVIVNSLSLFPAINHLIAIAILSTALYLFKTQTHSFYLSDYSYYINHLIWITIGYQLIKASSKSLAIPLIVLAFGFWGAVFMPSLIHFFSAPTHLVYDAKIIGIIGLCFAGWAIG